jgi:virginiamycin B lyase
LQCATNKSAHSRKRSFKPHVESLEERQLLAAAISGAIAEYPVPSNGRPGYIAHGPAGDNELWFTDQYNNRIGRIAPNGVFDTFYSVPTAEAQLGDITAGPDGNMWFLENLVDQIGKVTPDGQITEYRLPNNASNLQHIVAGPDGNLWFTLGSANVTAVVGRITTNGTVSEFSVPGNSAFHTPVGIAAGPDGALWLTEPYSNEIVRMSTSGQVQEFTTGISSDAFPVNIVAGSDGALWFTEQGNSQIGRITTHGVVTEFSTGIRPNSQLDAITLGPDGAVWFMEEGAHIANQVGRITTSGQVSEYVIPTYDHSGLSITAGRDGNVWFTETNPGNIGKVDLSALVPRLAFGAAAYSVNEAAGSITITIQRGGDLSGQLTVHYATSDGSALAGIAYTATAGNLTFAPGVSTRTFTVAIATNRASGGDETFNLTLSQPGGGASLGNPSTATVTIFATDLSSPPPSSPPATEPPLSVQPPPGIGGHPRHQHHRHRHHGGRLRR